MPTCRFRQKFVLFDFDHTHIFNIVKLLGLKLTGLPKFCQYYMEAAAKHFRANLNDIIHIKIDLKFFIKESLLYCSSDINLEVTYGNFSSIECYLKHH